MQQHPPLVMAFAIFFALVTMIASVHLRAMRDHNRRAWPSMQVGYLGLRIARVASMLGAAIAFAFLVANSVGG